MAEVHPSQRGTVHGRKRWWPLSAKALSVSLVLLITTVRTARGDWLDDLEKMEDPEHEFTGFTLYTGILASSSELGQVTRWDTSIGYDFNQYFSVGAGLPVYLVRSTVTPDPTYKSGLGNAHLDLKLTLYNPSLSFVSTLTGMAPTGSRENGFSTGRVTFDWNNHFSRTISRVTPFLNVGLGNTITDSHFFTRPFSSLGMMGHVEGGMDFRVLKSLSVELAGYSLLPSGQQKVYSRVLVRDQLSEVTGLDLPDLRDLSPDQRERILHRARRVFTDVNTTVGSTELTRDRGLSLWLDTRPAAHLDLSIGYSHSLYYDLNTFSLSLGTDLGRLLGRKNR